MRELNGLVTLKSKIVRISGRYGAFHTFSAVVGGETVHFDPVHYDRFVLGDVVTLTVTTSKSGAIACGQKHGEIEVTGHEEVAVIEEKTPRILEEKRADMRYISRPRYNGGEQRVMSKVGDIWVAIPVSAAEEYFGDEWEGSWPNGGGGVLSFEGDGDNRNVYVEKILAWEPHTRSVDLIVPLSKVRWGWNYIGIVDGGGKAITINHRDLPFVASPAMEAIKESFSGDLVMRVVGEQEMRCSYTRKNGVIEEWVDTDGREYVVEVDDEIIEKMNRIMIDRDRAAELGKGIKIVKALIAAEESTIDELVDELRKYNPDATAKDVYGLVWKEEYDTKYFEVLAENAKAIHPTDDGFYMEIMDSLVYERPEVGAATYIFNRPTFHGGVNEIMRVVRSFHLLGLRKGLSPNFDPDTEVNIAEKVGLVGVAIHTDWGPWLGKVMRTIGECEPREQDLSEQWAVIAAFMGVDMEVFND